MGRTKFKAVLTDFAENLEWSTDGIDNDMAIFELETEHSGVHRLYATLNEEGVVEFDVISGVAFEAEDKIPHEASSILLKRNAEMILGAWVLEEVDEQWVYSVMWNEHIDELEEMEYDTFSENIALLINEVETFNTIWEETFK